MLLLPTYVLYDYFFYRHVKNQKDPSSADESGELRKKKSNIDLDHRTIKQWKDHDKPDSVAIPIDKREALPGPKLPTMFRQNYIEPRASHYNEVVIFTV